MEGNVDADRRTILKTVGGTTAVSALGGIAANSANAAHADETRAVRVNQVGYPQDGQKIAVVTSDSDVDPTAVSEFEVQDASGSTLETYSLSDAFDDSSSGHTVKHADFSDFSQTGEFRIAVDGHTSHTFEIGDAADLYEPLLGEVGRLYTLKRANADIQDPVTGLDIGPGHMDDESATVAQPQGENYLSGTDLSAGDEIDVSGGWYDAGDYGKYVTPTAVTIGQMLLSYERHPDVFTVGQFDIPDSLNDPDEGQIPDVLAEAKKGLEFLEKMQRLNGALFYIVAGKNWPSMTTRPENDDQERFVFGTSSAGTAMACACFAQAARIYGEFDEYQDFADRMLQNAEDAFTWLDDNPGTTWLLGQGQNAGSGPYTRDSNDVTDRYWAAAELLRTTGDSQYDTFIQNLPQAEDSQGNAVNVLTFNGPTDWNNPVTLGHWAYYKAGGAEASKASEVLSGNMMYGLESLHDPAEAGSDLEAYGTGLYTYYWGCVKSGVARGVGGVLGADTLDYDEPAVEWSYGTLHHALGRSATGMSYMTGAGEESVQNPHDRIVASTGTLIPGMVVGGPNPQALSGQGDDCLAAPYSGDSSPHFGSGDSPADAMAYTDRRCSFATNEWAINYTAPVFSMLAEFVARGDGGGGTTPTTTTETTPTSPTSPADQWTNSVTATTIELGWDPVSDATGYRVYVDGDQAAETSDTVATITGLSPETSYEVGLTAYNDAGESPMVTTTVTTAAEGTTTTDSGPTPGMVGENTAYPNDPDDDGLYEDVNGNDEQDIADAVDLFQNRHDVDAQFFDFNDSGGMEIGDAVKLFVENSG